MRHLAIIALLTLTACGADGEPERPTQSPGVSITGKAEIGIVGS